MKTKIAVIALVAVVLATAWVHWGQNHFSRRDGNGPAVVESLSGRTPGESTPDLQSGSGAAVSGHRTSSDSVPPVFPGSASFSPVQLRPNVSAGEEASFGPVDRFAGAEVVASRDGAPDENGVVQRVKIVKADFKYPYVRVEEKVTTDPSTGEELLLEQTAMVADHLLVETGVSSDADAAQAMQAASAQVQRRLRGTHVVVAGLPDLNLDTLPNTIAALNRAGGAVVYAEPDYLVYSSGTPNDPQFGGQYALRNTGQNGGVAHDDIDATDAWNLTTGSRTVVVGIIDTGIDTTHSDLSANVWTNPHETAGNRTDDDHNGYVDDVHGWNFYSNNNNAQDDNLHGTHVAGIVAAVGNNGTGVSGTAWQTSLVPLKFLNKDGSGTTSDAIEAIYYAANMSIPIVNNSWGGSGNSASLQQAITYAQNRGVLFVAAAGNSGNDADAAPEYPGAYHLQNVISVAASTSQDALASFSNYGMGSVQLAAPGLSILSTLPSYKTSEMTRSGYPVNYGTLSGTSMATPYVTGVAALLKAYHPGWTFAQIKGALLGGVDVKTAFQLTASGGRLDAYKALRQSGNVTPFVTLPGDMSLPFGTAASLPYTITDPDSTQFTSTWWQTRGSKGVSLSVTGNRSVKITFPQRGNYTLVLSVNDGISCGTDSINFRIY